MDLQVCQSSNYSDLLQTSLLTLLLKYFHASCKNENLGQNVVHVWAFKTIALYMKCYSFTNICKWTKTNLQYKPRKCHNNLVKKLNFFCKTLKIKQNLEHRNIQMDIFTTIIAVFTLSTSASNLAT